MVRYIAMAAAATVALGLGYTAWLTMGRGADPYADCREGSVAGGGGAIGGAFSLVRQDGERVTDAQVIDRPTLVYFGFTYCPDVCPLDMARNAEVVDILKERGKDVRLVMITVDPERDTPEVIGDYVKWLHPEAIGLTGNVAEIETAKQAYKVYAAKNGEGEDYLVDHSTFTYLMAPQEGFLEFFRRDVEAERMAERVACFVDAAGA